MADGEKREADNCETWTVQRQELADNKMKARFIFCALLASTCVGCLVMPFRTDVSGVVKGRVSDYVSGQPVSGAHVTYAYSGTRWRISSETQEDGTFEVGPIYQWHWMLYLGDPGMVPPPAGLFELWFVPSTITITAEGYQPTNRQFQSACLLTGSGTNFQHGVPDDQFSQFQDIKLMKDLTANQAMHLQPIDGKQEPWMDGHR